MENSILKKPKFGGTIFQIINIIISFSISICSFIKLPENFTNFKRIMLIILIYISSYIFVLLIYNIFYTLGLNKYCKRLEEEIKKINKNRTSLIESNDKKDNQIKELTFLLKNTINMYDQLVEKIEDCFITPSEEEKNFLNKLLKTAIIKKEAIFGKKGNDYNG